MVDLPNTTVDLPNTRVDLPNTMVDLPYPMVDLPNIMVDLPNTLVDLPNTLVDLVFSSFFQFHPVFPIYFSLFFKFYTKSLALIALALFCVKSTFRMNFPPQEVPESEKLTLLKQLKS